MLEPAWAVADPIAVGAQLVRPRGSSSARRQGSAGGARRAAVRCRPSRGQGTRLPSGLVMLASLPKTSMARAPATLAGWPETVSVSPNVNVSGA